MSALEFALAMLPLGSGLAGLVLWLTNRDETLGDWALVLRFSLLLATATLLAWSAGRSEAVQLRINPAVRAQRALESQPVYAAFRDHLPGELPALEQALLEQAQRGVPLEEAFHRIRPLLTRVATDRLGFADHASRLAWGRQAVTTLRALEGVDAAACYAAIAGQPIDERTLAGAFSAQMERDFQRAVVAVVESGDRRSRDGLSPGDGHVELEAERAEYAAIHEALAAQLGAEAVAAISTKAFPPEPVLPAGQVCDARIAELEAILARPRDMAAYLIDAVLR